MTKHRFLLALLFLATGDLAAQLDESKIPFIDDVLFITEYSARPERNCKRWKTAPKLSLFGETEKHAKVIDYHVNQINACLPAANQIEIVSPEDDSATLKVYFIPYEQFGPLAEALGVQLFEQNWGIFYSWWDSDFVIEKSVVLIATDKLSRYRLQHFVLEELTQAMGFPGDSDKIEKSVFYEDKAANRFGKLKRLSLNDQDLIRFHYQYNSPGDSPIQVGLNLASYFRDRNESRK